MAPEQDLEGQLHVMASMEALISRGRIDFIDSKDIGKGARG